MRDEVTPNSDPSYIWGSDGIPPLKHYNMENKELKGREIAKITTNGIVKPYVNTTTGSQNHGKSYQLFHYLDKTFVVHQDNPFIVDKKAGKVYSAELGYGEEGLTLLNYITNEQEIEFAKTDRVLKALGTPVVQTEADVQALIDSL